MTPVVAVRHRRRTPARTAAAAVCVAAVVAGCASGGVGSGADTDDVLARTTPVEGSDGPPATPTAPPSTPAPTPSPTESATTDPAQQPAWAAPAPPWEPGPGEVLVEAKQLASEVAAALTTYGPDETPAQRRARVAADSPFDPPLANARELDYEGAWSRGRVVYPQMGGFAEVAASVMVVVEQTWGVADGEPTVEVRTLDVRLRRDDPDADWHLEALASGGGQPVAVDAPDAVDHPVLRDDRLVLPDSARWDVLAGRTDPRLLEVMSDIGEQFPVEVAVLVTGHPRNVFATDRLSAHTDGRAVDLVVVDDRTVASSHDTDSATRALVEWLYDDPRVTVIGSPWALDERGGKSFTDIVHADHIHVSVLSSDEDLPDED